MPTLTKVEVLVTAIRQRQEKLTGREQVKSVLYADDVIIYTENPEGAPPPKLLEEINEFNRDGYKSKAQKFVAFHYTKTKTLEKVTEKSCLKLGQKYKIIGCKPNQWG